MKVNFAHNTGSEGCYGTLFHAQRPRLTEGVLSWRCFIWILWPVCAPRRGTDSQMVACWFLTLHSRSTMPRLPTVSWPGLVTVSTECKRAGKHGRQTEGSLTTGMTNGMLTAAFATGFCFFLYSNFKLFYFVLGYNQLTNNVMIVSGEQRRDTAIHKHVFILPQTPLLSRLPPNTEFPVPQAFGL